MEHYIDVEDVERAREDLEKDLETLTEATETAEANRSSIYGWEVPDLWNEDDLDLGELELGVARGMVQTMQELAGEVASILEAARDKVQEKIDNLPDEVPCEECGAPIPVEDRDPLINYHSEWCENERMGT